MYHDTCADTSVTVNEMMKHHEEDCVPNREKRENIVESLLVFTPLYTDQFLLCKII